MRILLDMDGVLVDFMAGMSKILPDWTHEPGTFGKLTAEQWGCLGYEFWRDLPWMEDGQEILVAIESLIPLSEVFLCSSPCITDGCLQGKMDWIVKHMPDFRRRFIFTPAKHLFAGAGHLLIDDYDENISSFGSNSILVPRPWNSLHHLNIDPVYTVYTLLMEALRRERNLEHR